MHLSDMQKVQPWTVPYSTAVVEAATRGLTHVYGSHAVLHAMKSVGKLAALFEAFDHRNDYDPNEDEIVAMAAASADLVTAALRLANLYQFDLEDTLILRVGEKNGVGFARLKTAPEPEAKPFDGTFASSYTSVQSKERVPNAG